MIRNLFTVLFLFIITFCFALVAQSGMNPYQKKNFTTIKGSVGSIYTASPPGTDRRGVHLILKTASAEYIIHVCPQWYVDNHPEQFDFKKGDLLTVSGARFVTRRSKNNIYPASIVNHSSSSPELRLRDPDTGNFILWTGRFKMKIKNAVLSGLGDKIKKLQENVRHNVLSSYNNLQMAVERSYPEAMSCSYNNIP